MISCRSLIEPSECGGCYFELNNAYFLKRGCSKTMGSEFDPYRKLLGIKSQERPPNHYDLLGVDHLENRKEVIAAASIQRTELLQDIATGSEHVELSQRVLNEVAAARLCLLDAEQRKKYELAFKKELPGLNVAGERLSKMDPSHHSAEPASSKASVQSESKELKPKKLNPKEISSSHQPRSDQSTATRKTAKASSTRRTPAKRTQSENRWLIPLAAGILVFAVLASIAIATVIIMSGGESTANVGVDPVKNVAGQTQDLESKSTKSKVKNKSDRPAKKLADEPKVASELSVGNSSRKSDSSGEGELGGSANDGVDRDHGNEVPLPLPLPAVSPLPKNVLVSFDASEGNPRKQGRIQSPQSQGWKMANHDVEESQAVIEKNYSQPAWKTIASDSEKDIRVEFDLSNANFDKMWNRGWRLEVIARVEKGTGLIGLGYPRNFEPFSGKPDSQALLIYSAAKGDYQIRNGWPDKSPSKINNGINRRRFTKVVLECAAKSYEMKMKVAVLSSKRDREDDLANLVRPFTEASPFARKIGWLARAPKNDSNAGSSLIVRKIQLSILETE